MSAAVAVFLFGLAAGFVVTRLRPGAIVPRRERRLLEPAGWALMAAAVSLGIALLAWALLGGA